MKEKSRSVSVWSPRKPAAAVQVVQRQYDVRQAQREITFWTTKDGREIALDDMTDEHIANAMRVLTMWRVRLRKRDRDSPVIKDLADAISRFKTILRKRRKISGGTSKKLVVRGLR